jgi:hypothetical protein
VFEFVGVRFTVAEARRVTEPAAFPVTVSVATPPLAATVTSPVTDPAPVVWLKVTLSAASGPLVIVLPAASWIVAVNWRVVAEGSGVVVPVRAIWDGVPKVTVKSSVFVEVVGTALSVPAALSETVPARLPVTVSVATPAEAAMAASPLTLPLPLAWLNVKLSELSGPLVTVLPASSVIVAVTARVVPEARLEVLPDMTILEAVPKVTVKLSVFESVAPAFNVALAFSVSDPARLPVTVSVATPAIAAEEVRPVTEPDPPVWAKETVRVLSGPLVTVCPAASSIVAVNCRDDPDARAVVTPESTICVAGPNAVDVGLVNALVAVQLWYLAVILYR